MLIHKETFFQPNNDEIPASWVVQYWIDDPDDFPMAQNFLHEKDAREFEKTLTHYEDWLSSQEITLPSQ